MISMALPIICSVLQLVVLSTAQHLSIHPLDPVVPLGGSVQLNCSISCPLGTTNWKGLDTNLNGVYTGTGYSLLKIENASISMEGTRICVGRCPGYRGTEKHVRVNVYALPEMLHLSTSIKNGIPYLHCVMKGIYPVDAVNVNCYRGEEKLKGPTDTDEVEEDEDRTTLTWNWELQNVDPKLQTSFSCEAEMEINQQQFKRIGTLTLSPTEETPNTLTASDDRISEVLEAYDVKPSSAVYMRVVPTVHVVQKSTAMENELSANVNIMTDPNTQDVITPADQIKMKEKTTPASTSPSPQTLLSIFRIPRMKTIATSTMDPQFQQRTTIAGRQLSSFTVHTRILQPMRQIYKSKPLTETTTSAKNSETMMTTSIPNTFTLPQLQSSRVTQNIQEWSTSHALTSPVFTTLSTKKVHLNPSGWPDPLPKDEMIMWMVAPAVALAATILISLQLWRRLNKTGFFQPNHPNCKESAEEQDLLNSSDIVPSKKALFLPHGGCSSPLTV